MRLCYSFAVAHTLHLIVCLFFSDSHSRHFVAMNWEPVDISLPEQYNSNYYQQNYHGLRYQTTIAAENDELFMYHPPIDQTKDQLGYLWLQQWDFRDSQCL